MPDGNSHGTQEAAVSFQYLPQSAAFLVLETEEPDDWHASVDERFERLFLL
jgi:hypothetical protein